MKEFEKEIAESMTQMLPAETLTPELKVKVIEFIKKNQDVLVAASIAPLEDKIIQLSDLMTVSMVVATIRDGLMTKLKEAEENRDGAMLFNMLDAIAICETLMEKVKPIMSK